jgi:hypothetical protein
MGLAIKGIIMSKKQNLIAAAQQDPRTVAKLCQIELSQLDAGYHEQLYYLLGVAYAVADGFQKDYESWRIFVKNDFWQHRKKRPRPKHQPKALLHVMVYVFNANTKQRYDRAWKYATGLQLYWNQGLRPEEVPAKIKADGGIEALMKHALKFKRLREEPEIDIDSEYFNICKDEVKSSSEDQASGQAPDEPLTGGDPPAEGNEEKNSVEQRKKTKLLRLPASRSIRKQVRGLATGEKARLTVKRVEGQPGKVRVVAFKKIAS